MHARRQLGRVLVVAALTLACVACYASLAIAAGLWECNWCHQQYQGDSVPAALRFAKCPAKEMKQNHFWTKKG